MKVLIVEDGVFKQNSVIRVLKENRVTDYCVKHSLKEALEVAQREKFDLLVTDMEFPQDEETALDKEADGKNGLRLMLELASRNIRIPTIVFSTCFLKKEEKEKLKTAAYPFIAQICDAKIIKYCLAE